MSTIDLNADLGEGGSQDAALMTIVSSANIACGGHAGDEETMRAAIKAALPELRTMARIEISAGTDPTGTAEQNDKQIALRQAALKNLLVASGVRPEAIALVQDSPSRLGLSIRGMQPRTTQHAEMRQGNLVAFK